MSPATRGGKRTGSGRKPGAPQRTRSLKLPAALWDALAQIAEANGSTINACAREAMELYVGAEIEESTPGAEKGVA